MKQKQKTRYNRLPTSIIEQKMGNSLLKNILVVSSGFRTGESEIGYDIQREARQEWLIKYCTGGKGWYSVNRKKYKIKEGDLLLCPAQTNHSYGADPEDPWDVFWVYFNGIQAAKYMDLLTKNISKPVVTLGFNSKVEFLFNEILTSMEKGYAFQHLFYISNTLKTLLSYIYNIIDLDPSSRSINLEDIITFMMENIYSDLTLKELSEKMDMSRDHFSKLFKNKYGYSPIDYFIRMKMQKACELLTTTGLNINEVGLKLGYSDCYYFSRLFKKKIGISPSSYREKYS